MPAIEHRLDIAASPADAYAAIATPEGLRGWWAKDADLATEEGGTHVMRFAKDQQTIVMQFRIDELVRGERVAWTCTENGNPVWPGTTLTWNITSTGKGSTIHFKHDGFAEGESPPYQMTVQGWQHFMGSLQAYLSEGSGQPW